MLGFFTAALVAATAQDPGVGPGSAAADLPPLFGRPRSAPAPLSAEEIERRRAAFEAHLEAEGLVLEHDIVAPPWYFDDEPDPGMPRAEDWTLPPHRATIFLNFFGGTMSNGTNSALMESSCITGTVDYPAFTNSESLALAIIEIFRNKMEPYGVRIAYEQAPPPELPYQMVMMGGTPGTIGLPPGTLGVSCSSDCGDMWWRDTTFAFTEQSAQATTLGTTALQEAAHAFGLAHIDGSQHIMYPFASPGDKVWATSCTPYNDATGGINCKPTHDIFCGGGMQNDDAELMAYFGPNSPDMVPPEVTIVAPETDVLEVAPGTEVTVSAEITDNYEGAGWKFVVLNEDGEELASQPAFLFETSWTVSIPEGVYTLRVQAIDHDRNVGSDEVVVYAGVEPPAGTTTGDTDGGTDGGTSAGGTDGSGQAGSEDGCGCRTRGAGGPGFLSVFGLLALVRRRRA